MRTLLAVAAACASTTLAVGPVAGAGDLSWSATVDHVVDGDTVAADIVGDGIAGAVHVRNAGIQAMERGECGDAQASAAMRDLVGAGSVVLRADDAGSTSRDGAGRNRPLRYVDTTSGVDVQAQLLDRGLVLPYPFGGELARQDAYHRIAQQAALSGVGLWSRALCRTGPDQGARVRMWVNWDADGNDSTNINGEYVRLLNEGSSGVDLTGWWLRSPTNVRFRFPAGTRIPPGGTLTVHSGSGTNTSRDLYWGGSSARFYNPDPSGVHGFGAFLFDPDGDLRFWSMYPCVWGCYEPLTTRSNVTWTATYDPPGDESADPNLETLNLTNTSDERIDASHRVVTLLGLVLEFGGGTHLEPGETLRVHMGHGTQSRLHKYFGRDGATLANSGGSAVLRNVEGVQIGCARWGDGGPTSKQCTSTPVRPLDVVEILPVDFGRALRARVVPAGIPWTYRVERWESDRWTTASAGSLASDGQVTIPAAGGRYRLVVPSQRGYAGRTTSGIDLVPRAELEVGATGSTLDVRVEPAGAGTWGVVVERSEAGRWVEVESGTTDGSGTYSVVLPDGTYRVVVPTAHGMQGAVSGVLQVSQTRLSATVVAPAGTVGKLRVDVDPDRSGTASWAFELQRMKAGAWASVGTYRTEGTSERRTFTYLRTGTYRAVMPDQSGAIGGVSNAYAYTAARATLSVKVIEESALLINAGPALPRKADFTVKIKRRSGSSWVKYRSATTAGKAEKVTVNVPRGRYRVVVPKQHGYVRVASKPRFVAR